MDSPVLQFANLIWVDQMGSLILQQYSKRAKPCRQRLWTVGGSFERHQREGSVQFLCFFLLHICNIPHSHSPLVFWKTCCSKDTQVKFPFGWKPVVSHCYFNFFCRSICDFWNMRCTTPMNANVTLWLCTTGVAQWST